ncbi:protein kinase [Amycolatopsis sp. NPDC023774]|uniref:serine/threonine-protein kinase n=1 Tax=Amycolatopsis sp. NPDC023774 TaxID=3155015 RepID=UPI0033CB9D12
MDPLRDDHSTRPRFTLDDRPGESGPVFGDRYEVGGLLGVGATARVYRGHDRRLGREVAIKVFNRDAVAEEQRRRLREVGIHAGVDHPGVVALLDSGSEEGRMYLVTEFVAGENLAQRLLGGPLGAEEVAAMAIRLADALVHLHAAGVTHRDLKPANILLGERGPLIADFGIAHALDVTRVTATGTVVGTAAYMAPEQVVGDPVGPAADVYALGLILLECLTGKLEYPGTMVEAAVARLTRRPRIPAGLPAGLSDLLDRMTAREPGARPTAAAVHSDLTRPAVSVAATGSTGTGRSDTEPIWPVSDAPTAGQTRPGGSIAGSTRHVPDPPATTPPRHRQGRRAAAVAALVVGAAAIVVPLHFGGSQQAATPPPAPGSQTPPPAPVSVPHSAAATLRAAAQPVTQVARNAPAAPPPIRPPNPGPKKEKHHPNEPAGPAKPPGHR